MKMILKAPGTLSEMEGCVLGIVWDEGPCTAYAIRQVFLRSPSPQWSGSAGSIYPLIERLHRRKLLLIAAHSTGQRTGYLCQLTPAGRRTLHDWLTGISDWTAGVPMDPLRTRLSFLGALDQRRRMRFLESAQRKLEAQSRIVSADCRRKRAQGNVFRYLVARGALASMKARIQWMKEVRMTLSRNYPAATKAMTTKRKG